MNDECENCGKSVNREGTSPITVIYHDEDKSELYCSRNCMLGKPFPTN